MRVRTFVFLAIVMALPIGAQAPTSNRSADSAFARGDWSIALSGYQSLVKTDTVSPSPWLRMAIAQHGLGQYKEAVDALKNASRRGANPFAVEFRFARAYAKLGDASSALTHLDSAVKIAPGGMLPATIRDDPEFTSIRDEPRFKAVVARLAAIRYPCQAKPEAQNFNFWVGKWDVALWNAPAGTPINAAGFNDVHPMLENCVIYENWTGAGGGEGKSFNFFDTNTGKWRQIWVADGGGSLDYSGEFRDGAMRFEGKSLSPQGVAMLQKLTFTPFGKDTVRQTFEASADGGKTWNVTFDARYLRRK